MKFGLKWAAENLIVAKNKKFITSLWEFTIKKQSLYLV